MKSDRFWREEEAVGAGRTAGVFPATLIATPQGWCRAQGLAAGSVVLTVGRGPQDILAVAEGTSGAVLHVPAGACGNRAALALPAGQGLLMEAELAQDLAEEPFAVIPALALAGWRGVETGYSDETPLRLILPQPGLIYAGPGLLLPCAGLQSLTDMVRDPGLAALSLRSARNLVACLMAEEAGLAVSRYQAALRLPPKRP